MKKGLIALAVLAVVVLAVVLTTGGSDNPSTPEQTTSNSSNTSDNSNDASQDATDNQEPAPESATIVYTSSGFSPASYEVAVGGSVTVRNDSDEDLDFASDNHPTHEENSELNAGEIAPGESKTFTVTTAGNWSFHNHHNSSHTGRLTVR